MIFEKGDWKVKIHRVTFIYTIDTFTSLHINIFSLVNKKYLSKLTGIYSTLLKYLHVSISLLMKLIRNKIIYIYTHTTYLE